MKEDTEAARAAPFFPLYLSMLGREVTVVRLPADSPDTERILTYSIDQLMWAFREVRRDSLQYAVYHDMVFKAWLAMATGRLKLPFTSLETYSDAVLGLMSSVTDTVMQVVEEVAHAEDPNCEDHDAGHPPFRWGLFQAVLAAEQPDAATIDQERASVTEELLDVIVRLVKRGVPLSGIEAALLYQWLCVANALAESSVSPLAKILDHSMLVAQRAADGIAQLCADLQIEPGFFVDGMAALHAHTGSVKIPLCELSIAEPTVLPDARTALDLVLALERADDPELATFLWRHICSQHARHVFSSQDLLSAAQIARDAGDVAAHTVWMIADHLSRHPGRGDPWLGAGSSRDLSVGAALALLGEPQLTQLWHDDPDAYDELVFQASDTILKRVSFPAYDSTLHMLPLAAAMIARAVLADPRSSSPETPEQTTLVANARRLVALDASPHAADRTTPRMARYEERALIWTLVCTGWRAVTPWDAEPRAHAILGPPPPSLGTAWVDYLYRLEKWLNRNPPLLEIGLICLGVTATFPPHPVPAPAPLLMNGNAKVTREIVRTWLLDRGYVRIHDVLLAALAEPMLIRPG